MLLNSFYSFLQLPIFSNGANKGIEPNCPIDIPLSCSNKTVINNSCCFEYPGGIFLQTQFWNYFPSKSDLNETELVNELGPLNSFTIHGLWPDNCHGGYQQFCNRTLQIDDVYYLLNEKEFNNNNDTSLQIPGKQLLEYLDLYWKSNNGNHESLWIHEFNKHGTCISTIRPECYTEWEANNVDKKRTVYDYFRITYNLFKKLDTFAILKKNDIVPSVDKTYSLEQIESALSKEFGGKQVYIGCDRHNALNEIWYYNHLKGSLLSEMFVPMDSLAIRTNCRNDAVKFFPKGYVPPFRRRPNKGESYRGVIRLSNINNGDQMQGFLIKNGHWMSQGTPANYELIKSPYGNYYLRSKQGFCDVISSSSNELVCKFRNIKDAGQFDFDLIKGKDGYIGYSGKFGWGSDDYPRRRSQSPVSLNNDKGSMKYEFKMKFIKN
ncbi:ribonuclease T2-like [Saccharomyces pastorianus]|uniref:Ribonuclease T2-like n=1 Tax=Saccharomyces pastorianus TaxID=27292 RepID=A0A6C1EHM3_SACPS|nr:ribonuclease T2-like [Saccharomyces pastorianus]